MGELESKKEKEIMSSRPEKKDIHMSSKEELNEKDDVSKPSDTTGSTLAEENVDTVQEKYKTQADKNISDALSNLDDMKIEAGVLKVIIHKASKIENLDTFGKSYQYVKLKFNDMELKSNTLSNTLEPEWSFANDFKISENQNNAIEITVYDSDIGRDDIQGRYSLSIREAIANSEKGPVWYNLVDCKSGRLFVSTFFSKMSMSKEDIVEGPSDIKEECCDSLLDQEETSPDAKNLIGSKDGKSDVDSTKKEYENGDMDEDTDKLDDDISESEYSYITVADISKKEDISRSETDDPKKLE